MNYFIIDDDPAIRAMLTDLIEDEDLGKVVGEAEDGSLVDNGEACAQKSRRGAHGFTDAKEGWN